MIKYLTKAIRKGRFIWAQRKGSNQMRKSGVKAFAVAGPIASTGRKQGGLNIVPRSSFVVHGTLACGLLLPLISVVTDRS